MKGQFSMATTKSNSTVKRAFLPPSINYPHISYIYSSNLEVSRQIAEIIPSQHAHIYNGGIVVWYIQTTTPTPDIFGIGGKIGAYAFDPNYPHEVTAYTAPLDVERHLYPDEQPNRYYGISTNQLRDVIKIIQKSKKQLRPEPRISRMFIFPGIPSVTLGGCTNFLNVDDDSERVAVKEFLYKRKHVARMEYAPYLDSGDEPNTHRALLRFSSFYLLHYPIYKGERLPKLTRQLIKEGLLPPVEAIEPFPSPYTPGDPLPKYCWSHRDEKNEWYAASVPLTNKLCFRCEEDDPMFTDERKAGNSYEHVLYDVLHLDRSVPVIWAGTEWVVAVDVQGLSGITRDGYAPDFALGINEPGRHSHNGGGGLYTGTDRYSLLDRIKNNGGDLDRLFSNVPTIRIELAEKPEGSIWVSGSYEQRE